MPSASAHVRMNNMIEAVEVRLLIGIQQHDNGKEGSQFLFLIFLKDTAHLSKYQAMES